MAKGKIKDMMTGKVYKAKSELNSNKLLQIAKEAKEVNYIDGYVNWLNAAFEKAKSEKQDSKYIEKIR